MARPYIPDEPPLDLNLTFGRGEHHTAPETRVPDGYARRVIDFDIDDYGLLTSRPAPAVNTLPGGHSMFVSRSGRAYYISGMNLVEAVAGAAVPVLDQQGAPVYVTRDDRVWYVEVDGRIYWSNGTDTGSITPTGGKPWGVPNPVVATEATDAAQTAYVTWVDSDGEESGAVRCDTGWELTGNVGHVRRVYFSTEDSELFRLGGTGKVCDTIGRVPMPAGRFVTWHGGRIYTVVDDLIVYSDPFRYGLHDPGYSYIKAPGAITAFGAVSDGLYVVTAGEAWFLSGTDPSKMTFDKVSDTGAFDGGQVYVPFHMMDPKAAGIPGVQQQVGEAFAWLGPQGYSFGLPSGIVTTPGSDRHRLPTAGFSNLSVLSRAGYNQLVAVVNSGPSEGSGAAVDSPLTQL